MTAKLPPRVAACQWCGQPMPDGLRSHARFCRAYCRVMAWRASRQGSEAARGSETVTRAAA